MDDPSEKIVHGNGARVEYWNNESGAYVIKDYTKRDSGTAFRPKRGYEYFEEQKLKAMKKIS